MSSIYTLNSVVSIEDMKIHTTMLGLLLALIIWVIPVIAQEGTPLQYQYLWDPESPDIQDWQMLSAGSGTGGTIIWGDRGEIFLIDRRSAHILRLTRNGDLIEIIGRRGQGPGKFSNPEVLAYDKATNMLWVADGYFKYSRFILKGSKYVYMDSFTAPTTWAGTWPNLLVHSTDQYWGTGRTLGPFQDLRTAVMETARIKLVDIEDGVLREFGPFWEVGQDASWSLLESGMHNAGFIHRLNGKRLAWIWMYRPIIEVWSEDGDLLVQRVFDDIPVISPRRTGSYTSVAPSVMARGEYDEEADLLFIRLTGREERAQFVGLDTRTLEEKERYYLEIPGLVYRTDPKFGGIEVASLDNVTIMPTQILVERVDGEIRFYSIDQITRSLIILFPK